MARRRSVDGGTSSTVGDVTVVRLSCPCGWCMTGDCDGCKSELLCEKKLYMCGCTKCCDGHVPSIGVESEAEEPESEPEEDLED